MPEPEMPIINYEGTTGLKLNRMSAAAGQVQNAYGGFGEAFVESMMEDSFPAQFAKWYYTPDEDDPNFNVTPEFFSNEAPDLMHRYDDLKDAGSLPEFTYRADRIRREEKHLQKLGNTDFGLAAMMTAGIVDPAFLGVTALTWGAGSLPALAGKGGQLGLLSMGAGRAAMLAGRPSRLAGLARGGILTGTAEGSLLGIQTQLSDTYTASDAVFGTLMAGALGGAIGGLLPGSTVTGSWTRAADELVAIESTHPAAQALRRTARGEAVMPHTSLPAAPTGTELAEEVKRLDTLLEETDDVLRRSEFVGPDADDVDVPLEVTEGTDFVSLSADELSALQTRRTAIMEARETLNDRLTAANTGVQGPARPPRVTDSSEWLPGQAEIDTIVVRERSLLDELHNSNVEDTGAGYGSFGSLDSKDVHKDSQMPTEGPNNDTFIGRMYNWWETFLPFRALRSRSAIGLNSKNARIRAMTSVSEEDGLLRTKYPLEVAARRAANQALTVLAQKMHHVTRRAHAHLRNTNQVSRFRGVGWRGTFNRAVADYVSTGKLPEDARLGIIVKEAGQHVRDHYKVMRDYAVKNGKLPADVPSDPRYLPRMANKSVFQRITKGGKNSPYDEEWLENFMTESLIKGSADKGLELKRSTAKKLVKRYISNVVDPDAKVRKVSKETSLEAIKDALRRDDVAEDIIDEITDFISGNNPKGDFSHAHRRMLFDEGYTSVDKNGDVFEFRDLLDNDIVTQAELYTRRLTGAVEWQNLTTILHRMTPDDPILRKAESGEVVTAEELVQWVKKEGDITRREAEYVRSAYRAYHQLPLSRQLADHPNIAKWLRGASWLMHTRVMNKVGLSTLPEVFAAVGTHGLHMMYHATDIKSLARPIQAGGKRAGRMAAAAEAISGGLGSDLMRRLHIHRMDAEADFAGAGLESPGWRKWRNRSMAFISDVTHRNPVGMGPIDTYTRTAAMSAAISDFLWGIHKVGKKKGVEGFEKNAFNAAQKRMADLGLDEEWQARIWTAMQQPGAVGNVKGSHSIYNHVDFDAWADPEAVEMFGMALYRHVNRIVQRPDFGTVAPWMDSPIGRVVAQFRSFMYVANTKQLAYNLSKADVTAFNTMMMSFFGGTLTYYTMIQAGTIGMNASDREEYLRKYLYESVWNDLSGYKWKDILWNGVGRTGFATTLIPAYVSAENILGIPDEDRLFGPQSRNTGLGMGLFNGIPAVDYIYDAIKVGETVRDVAFGREDFTEEDANAIYKLMPLQNLLGVNNIFKRLIEELGLPSQR